MRTVRFPYSTYRGLKAPIIPLFVRGKTGWKEIWIYVDSGAAFSIFAASEAERLDLEFTKGSLVYAVVGDGGYIPVYLHKLPIRIGNIELKATIGFSEKLGVGFNLLGRKDIFEKFKVSFVESKGFIEFVEL